MEKVLYSIVWMALVGPAKQIYVPNDGYSQKPVTYTPEIQTSRLQMHHNYSRVYHQTYVLNGTKISKASNPTRQIVIYNKEKRAPKPQVYRTCPEHATGQFVYETSCHQFLNCWKGRGYVQNCPAGTLFNPRSSECDYPEKVTCISGPRETVLHTKRSPKQVGCPKEFSGLIPNYTDCSKFINCVSGIENFMDCPAGTLFDVDKNICDFAHKANCFNGENRNLIEGNVDGKLDFGQRLSYKSGEVTCPEGEDGLHPHPYDCSRFLNCAHGQTYVQSCGPGTVFNPGLKVCDYPYNVRCTNGSSERSSQYSQQSTGAVYIKGVDGFATRRPHYQFQSGTSYGSNVDSSYGGGSSVGSQYDRGSTNQFHSTYDQQSLYGGGTQYNGGATTSYDRDHSRQLPYGTSSNVGSQYDRGTTSQFHSTSSNGRDHGQHSPFAGGSSVGNQYDLGSTNEFQSGQIPYGGGATTLYGHDGSASVSSQYDRGSTSQVHSGHNYGGVLSTGTQYDRGSPSQLPPINSYGRDHSHQSPYGGSSGTASQYDRGSPSQLPPINSYGRDHSHQSPYGGGSGTGSQYDRGIPSQLPPINSYGRDHAHQSPYGGGSGTGSQYDRGTPSQLPPINSYDRDHGHQSPYAGGPYDQTQYNRGSTSQFQPTNSYRPSSPYDLESGWNRNYTHNTIGGFDPAPNYDQVVNINQVRRTTLPPYRGTTFKPQVVIASNDYEDYNPGHGTKYVRSTTPRTIEKHWPPPFPSTDVNADYVFENEDDEAVTLEAENSVNTDGSCKRSELPCGHKCLPMSLVCNGVKDCPDGKDEIDCLDSIARFSVQKNKKLAVMEKERWDNVSIATCATLCLDTRKSYCRSFNYRKIDKTCFLSDTNEGLTGGIISYYPFDYYELTTAQVNCSNMFVCPNKKCINRNKICDGHDDCGDRLDEKNCRPQDLGYSLRLTGSNRTGEGLVQVTAFGKTGYVCDDNFGLRDANVVCKELGFDLGAAEVKKNSFFVDKGAKTFYMMDDVGCLGNETRLLDCDFSGWGVHNCLGQEAVGVICKTPTKECASDYWKCDTGRECLPLAFVCDGLDDCSDNSDEDPRHCDAPTQVRLANGSNSSQGRVEIRHHGTWGTICDDDFNEDAAKVLCRQLGFKGAAVVKKDAYFGPGSGPIWLDQVFCSGNESSVEECSHWNWGEHNCDHNEDVGVICSSTNQYAEYIERHSRLPAMTVPQHYPERCGYRNDVIFNGNDGAHFRVVKGSVARKGDYPWQAAIRIKGKSTTSHWCGAVIIHQKFVLTAAHCLVGYSKGVYVIVAGDYNTDDDEGTEQEARIEDYYLHEDFKKGHKMNNDIALVKLKGHGFYLNDHVQAICLPDADSDYDTRNCTISGFGSVESGKSGFSHDMRAGWVPIQKKEICTMPHVYGDALTDGMFCAGSLDEGVDSCDGDSGGPLACLDRGVFTLYGITSWGQHCGHANKPGVYVKVAHYRKWIDDHFKKYSADTNP